MAPFKGFLMPLQYSSPKEEVLAVRNNAGLFDISHMGELIITGKDAVSFSDYIMTNNFKDVGLNKAVYSPICNDEGKILDDIIAYKLSPEAVLFCVNASNIEKDWQWFKQKAQGLQVNIQNESSQQSLLAIQGPDSESILRDLSLVDMDQSTP